MQAGLPHPKLQIRREALSTDGQHGFHWNTVWPHAEALKNQAGIFASSFSPTALTPAPLPTPSPAALRQQGAGYAQEHAWAHELLIHYPGRIVGKVRFASVTKPVGFKLKL